MDKEKLMALVGVGLDETERLSQELGRPIDVDRSALVMLARIAMHQPDGEDYMRAHVRILVEDMVRRFPDVRRTSTSTTPPDADERRQAGQFHSGMSLL